MIKIVFLIDRLACGGAEQALFDLVRLMDKRIFDITVFVIHEGDWDQKFRSAGIRVVHSYSGLDLSRSFAARAKNYFRRKKIEKAWKNQGSGLLKAALPGEKFDIVVPYLLWRLRRAGVVENAKTVCYFHWDVRTYPFFREITEKMLPLIPCYDRVFCVSKEAGDSLRELVGIDSELHYNPIDSQRIREMAQVMVDISRDIPYVCAVGRLAPEKGFVRLVHIHKRLLEIGVEHKIVIVGEGNERENIKQAIRETGTEDSVFLAGYQNNPYPYMKNSKFLVCSSFTEALPVISMEALCLGIPIVSSAPSIGEVFGDEVCGCITGSDDDSLFEGMKRMLTDDVFYQNAKTGAEKRSAFFNGERMAKEVEEVFLELVK